MSVSSKPNAHFQTMHSNILRKINILEIDVIGPQVLVFVPRNQCAFRLRETSFFLSPPSFALHLEFIAWFSPT